MSGNGVVAETERLSLREATDADAAFMFALLNDPDYLRFIGDRNIHSIADAASYIATRYRAGYAEHGFGLWLVEENATGATIGVSGLVRREGLDAPDIGYAFLPAYRGQGYALEAARAVLEIGRSRFRLPRVLAITNPDNAVPHRLLLGLGFRQNGTVTLGENAETLRIYEIRFPEDRQ
ncbi:GNAT family N-acetyltransferase [Stappia sp. F7233]|uniref:GNAT family N-acetyltransferase n=1 Tax=Stappia albiluteola TaxID=2758565 RepID=A0A839AJG4_9HYPH|nr:GNAT family N-acetyltransferase [Stappia albiluteola]MBA5778897.1 GNAT family N-acetyltransferase [Stappia albiluteola]